MERGSLFDQALVTVSPAQLASHGTRVYRADYLKGLLDLKNLGAVVMVVSLETPTFARRILLVQPAQKRRVSHSWRWWNTPTLWIKNITTMNISFTAATTWKPITNISNSLKKNMLQRFLPSFKKINPDFTPDWINQAWVFKAGYAQPVPFLNHSKNIPAIETPIPGLYFASMSQVYPWDRGTNFAVEIARRAAKLMLSQ
jgi:hypothetical protein